jgi:hypothetical protein
MESQQDGASPFSRLTKEVSLEKGLHVSKKFKGLCGTIQDAETTEK